MGNRNNAIYFVIAIFAVLLSVISVSQAVNYSKASEARAVLSLVSEWKPELAEKLAESSTDNICGLAIPGVFCDGQGRVAKISLMGQNLRGSIPAIIGDLTHLIALDLSGNNIYGSIPESLARLPRLRELNLEGNPISGPLPAFVGAFPVLVKLNIRATGLNACPSPTWIQSVSQCCISEASTCSSSFTHCAGACNADKVEFTRAVHRADAPTGGAKFNTREIAGIAVGAVIAAVIIGVIIFFIVTEAGRKTEDEQQMEMPRRFGQPDSSLTTNSREGSLPDRSKPPLPANISSSTSSSSSYSSSSSSSSSRSEEDFPAPPKEKRKSLPADQVIEENAEEQKSPAVDAKSSHDALLKPRRKKRRKPKVTAASADE